MTMQEAAAQPPKEIADLANLSWGLQVLNAAAGLKIPDLLVGGALDVQSLAKASGAHAPSLARLLRALQALGICRPAGNGAFELTEGGHFLREGVAGSIRGQVMFSGGILWKQFGDLLEVVKTGKAAPSVAAGAEGFDKLAEDPGALHAFHRTMVATSINAARDAVAVHDFGRYRTLLDLGGGYGGVLAVLLQTYPELEGEVCDLAYLAEDAAAYLESEGVADRARFRGGNFFESVPAGFDCCFLKFIIHDWDDEHARLILRNCAKAAGAGSVVLLLEQVVPDIVTPDPAYRGVIRSDLTMLTVGGKERTAEEYRELLSASGLRLAQITPTGAGFSLIESVPA